MELPKGFVVNASPKSMVVQALNALGTGRPVPHLLYEMQEAYKKIGKRHGKSRENLLSNDKPVQQIQELIPWSKKFSIEKMRNILTTCAKNPKHYGGGWSLHDKPQVPVEDRLITEFIIITDDGLVAYRLTPGQRKILQLLWMHDEGLSRSDIAKKTNVMSTMVPELGPSLFYDEQILESEAENGQKSLMGMRLVTAAVDPMSVGRETILYSLTEQGNKLAEYVADSTEYIESVKDKMYPDEVQQT